MIEFRQKDFSNILKSTMTGASIGGSLLTAVPMFFRKDRQGNELDPKFRLKIAGGGLLIGAALGALVGGIDDLAESINRKATVDKRLMKTVVDNLKRAGLKEGSDFTLDPKRASELKTRVAVCISKVSGDLKILINITSDPKLKDLTKAMTRNIPNTSAVSENISDRFNTITITTISDSSADAGLITGIAERYIHSGYPVQLVEVG